MTAKDIELLMQAIAPVIKDYTEGKVAPLRAQLTQLESKLTEGEITKAVAAEALRAFHTSRVTQ